MLNWLDADSNRKGAANENLARELMELFTLGIGNYGEKDIQESARALTGWTVRRNAFFQDDQTHDEGPKTILGQTGHWRGGDVVRILLAQKATSRRLAWRICELFFGEGAIGDEAIGDLAEGSAETRSRHRLGGGDSAQIRRLPLRREHRLARCRSPGVHRRLGARSLEVFRPPPSTLLLAEWSTRMGQDLFYPPNVGGWSGGRGLALLTVYRGACELCGSSGRREIERGGHLPSTSPACRSATGCEANLQEAINWFDRLLLGGRLSAESRRRVFLSG